jgi:hypothetical protein
MPPVEWVLEMAGYAATAHNINGLIIDVSASPPHLGWAMCS